jgi:hypothetical protein
MAKTKFSIKCDILAEFWVAYKGDENYEDFISYNDLGLPLAYAISTDIVERTRKAKTFVEETWDVFLGVHGLEDEGYESLDDILPIDE